MNTHMTKYLLSVSTFFLFLFSPFLSIADDHSVAHFKSAVDGILDHRCLKNKNYGIKIYSLDKKEILYQVNNDRLLIPASNMKLFTTAVALKELGPDYRFITQIYSPGKIEGETLKGDLYVKGFGDPKLVTEQMWQLVNGFRNIPIRKVEGNIIADDSYFDDKLRVDSWKKSFGARAYNAPIGSLSLNFNTVTVYVSPGARPGDKPVVVVDPSSEYIHVNNTATTLSSGHRSRLVVNRLERDGYDEVLVTGGMPIDEGRGRFYMNITDPTAYAIKVFKEYLKRNGIEVTGDARIGAVPPQSRLLLTHESEPLSDILRNLNKYSNNFIAEQILKTMAAERFGAPGTTANGLKVMDEFMTSMGYSAGQYEIWDGSGLSRQNRVTPDQIVHVLTSVYNDWGIYPEFISALGVMGLDGSVRKRMRNVSEAQQVRVKTGTLNFTSAVSGYFQSRMGERFAFSIIMNDLKCSIGEAISLQDKVIHEGLMFDRGNPTIASREQLR